MVTREEHTIHGKSKMCWDKKRLSKHVLLGLAATNRALFCWQCFSDLDPVLLGYLHCLCQCRQFGQKIKKQKGCAGSDNTFNVNREKPILLHYKNKGFCFKH